MTADVVEIDASRIRADSPADLFAQLQTGFFSALARMKSLKAEGGRLSIDAKEADSFKLALALAFQDAGGRDYLAGESERKKERRRELKRAKLARKIERESVNPGPFRYFETHRLTAAVPITRFHLAEIVSDFTLENEDNITAERETATVADYVRENISPKRRQDVDTMTYREAFGLAVRLALSGPINREKSIRAGRVADIIAAAFPWVQIPQKWILAEEMTSEDIEEYQHRAVAMGDDCPF